MGSTDDFIEAARQEVRRAETRRSKCAVGLMLAEFPADLAEQVVKAMAETTITTPAIRTALEKRSTEFGPAIPSVFSLNRHRRMDCACGR